MGQLAHDRAFCRGVYSGKSFVYKHNFNPVARTRAGKPAAAVEQLADLTMPQILEWGAKASTTSTAKAWRGEFHADALALAAERGHLEPKLSDSFPQALIFGSKGNLYKRRLLNA